MKTLKVHGCEEYRYDPFVDYIENGPPIKACCFGGGSGGGSTTSVDTAYNARMATIAEAQQGMAQEYFQEWRDIYKPYERAQVEANKGLIPAQTALAGEQIASERSLLPSQTALTSEQISSQRSLLPSQTALASEQISSARELLPGQTAVGKEYYTQALKGVSTLDEMAKARADVESGYIGAEGELRRSLGRTGIDPSSGTYASLRGKMARAKAASLAGAATGARRYAELESFNRLRGAIGGAS